MITVDEDRVDVTPDLKNAPVGADCLPDSDLSDSRVEPGAGVPTSELQASDGDVNGGTTNHELENIIEPPNNKPENSKSLANEQSNNADASDNNQQVNYEAPPSNPSIESETPYENQPVSSEATLDQKFYAEVNFEEIPNDVGVVVSETQHINEVALPETQHSNGMIIFETQQSNEVVMSEEQTINDVVMTEAMTENELAISTIDSNHHLSHPEETHSHNHHFVDFHMIPEDQLPQPKSLPNCDPLPCSEQREDSHIRDIKLMHHDHLTQYDTVPNNHLDHFEALSPGQLANSQMLHHYELENNEILHENQLVNSQEHYGLVNANIIPNYEIVSADTPLNCEEPTPDTHPNKRRKKKSIVWEHFTIENVDPECRRAYCKQCNQSFAYSTGSCLRTIDYGYGLCSLILPTNKYGLVGTKDGSLEIIDIGSGTRVEVIEAYGGFVRTIVALPDRLSFVIGSADHEVKFWDYQIKQKIGQATKQLTMSNVKTMRMNDDVLVVAISPDAKYIVVALLDSTVKIHFVDTFIFFLSLYRQASCSVYGYLIRWKFNCDWLC